MKALLPILVPALEQHGHLQLKGAMREKLLNTSAASIDRLLKPARSATPPRRKRLATALRKSIPVRTFADWNDPLPGSMEADLVLHCGETTGGSYVSTCDHVVRWRKPARPKWMSEEQYRSVPEALTLRETQVRGKVLVTSMLDPQEVSARELEEVFIERWNVELDLRNIKSTSGHGGLELQAP